MAASEVHMTTPIHETLAPLCKADGWSNDILDSPELRYAAAFLVQFAYVGKQGIVFPQSRINLDEDIALILRPNDVEITTGVFVNGLKQLAGLGLIAFNGAAVVIRRGFVEMVQVQTLAHQVQARA